MVSVQVALVALQLPSHPRPKHYSVYSLMHSRGMEHLLFLETGPQTSLLSSCTPTPIWKLILRSGSLPPSCRLGNFSGMDA